MQTDKEIYTIFKNCPASVAALAGIEDQGSCTLESVTIKRLERRLDALLRPDDPEKPLIVIEVQFQKDPEIYPRIITEMAAVQQDSHMRSVRGIIFFADEGLDPKTDPWSTIIKSVALDSTLAERERKFPDDPFVTVFKPVFEDLATLEKHAAKYYRSLKSNKELSPRQASALADVFFHWILERLENRTYKEMAALLEFKDVKETRAGKDLIEIGREEGREKGREEGTERSIIMIARKRFGADAIAPDLEEAIRALHTPALDQLLDDLLDLPSAEALRARVSELKN